MLNDTNITIGVPVYNGAKTIEKCLQGIQNQSLFANEILISDDCSDDESVDTIKQILAPGFKLISGNYNKGLYGNHNAIAKIASSQWILFVHQDDVLTNNAVKMINTFIKSHHRIAFGCIIGPHLHIQPYINPDSVINADHAFLLFLKVGGVTPSGTIFNKNALKQISGFDDNPLNLSAQDFCLRLAKAGFSFGILPKVLTPDRVDSTWPKMVADGRSHLMERIVFPRIFDGSDDDRLIELILSDIHNWSNEQVASLLRKLTQADLFEYANVIKSFIGSRIDSVRKCPDYKHVRLKKVLGMFYWPALKVYKRFSSLILKSS